MASDLYRVRDVDELLVTATDVGVIDRAALSLWHFQHLLRPHFPAREPPDPAAESTDDNENRIENEAPRQALENVELDDGMAVGAVTFVDDSVTIDDSGDRNADDDPIDDDDGVHAIGQARLTMNSKVSIVYQRYKCVLYLDASPSALSIDAAAGRVFLDMLYESVELFVRNLMRPMEINSVAFEPEHHVSVIVQGAYVDSLCVIIQSFVLHQRNTDDFLRLVRDRLTLLEDDWAATKAASLAQSDDRPHRPRSSLATMLQNAVYALNSLPSGAAPVLVLATDGVVDFFSGNTYDGLLMQLVRHDVQCHFIRVGTSAMSSSFGFVPDFDLLDFVAHATGGSVIDYLTLHGSLSAGMLEDQVKSMTSMQSSLLLRKSTVQTISAPLLLLDANWCASFDGLQHLPLRPYRMWRQKVHEYRIHADVDRVVEARVREGFIVNKVHIRLMQRTQDGTLVKVPSAQVSAVQSDSSHAAVKVLVVFALQWKQGVWIEYVVSSTIELSQRNAGGSSRSTSVKQSSSTMSSSSALITHLKRESPGASDWSVKVNILADTEFLRAFDESRMQPSQPAVSGTTLSPGYLHDFVRNVQDVDRVLLHLMTAVASMMADAELSSQFSFGTQASQSISANHNSTQKSQSSHPVFGIIGDLSPVLWHRWFHVERFEVLSVVADEPSADEFYPRTSMSPLIPRGQVPLKPSKAFSRGQQRRRTGASGEVGTHPLLVDVDQSVDRVRTAIFRWSSQRLNKDLYLKFLNSDCSKGDSTVKASKTVAAAGQNKRRQQRGSLTSATLSVQIASGLDQSQGSSRCEEKGGSLCFVRVEVKNRTLLVVHVAFFSSSSTTRRETLTELKRAVTVRAVHSNAQRPNVGGIQHPAAYSAAPTRSRIVVLCHRMISRLLVTHDTLELDAEDPQDEGACNSVDDHEKPLVGCCGGSELQIRSVFRAFMWHTSWKWLLQHSSSASVSEVMRHLHEARVRAGFWVLDWKLEEDGDATRVASVIFGREILMEDGNGDVKTSFIQYGIRRSSEHGLVTSLWMEPQHGFAKTVLPSQVPESDRTDAIQATLRHAIGHDVPMNYVRGSSEACTDAAEAQYLDEGRLLQLIREYVFESDRHILSCLQTFEAVLSVNEGSVPPHSGEGRGVVGVELIERASACDNNGQQEERALVPSFSTARLLDASTRSTEHFLMYLERSLSKADESSDQESPSPALSAANMYLYSMLEQTLRSLSDCEVAWTDIDGQFISAARSKHSLDRIPSSTSQVPIWFARNLLGSTATPEQVRCISEGRCFAKLLPNETVLLAFLPAVSTLQLKKRAQMSPVAGANSTQKPSTMARWRQRQLLKTATSLEANEATAETSTTTGVLKMSVSADDIVLYQERRQSFREGYKSWRMGLPVGARDEKTHRTGSSGPLSPHPKTVTFSEDYEFCDSLCLQADLGCDFHLLIEKADGALGSGYFQVAFYECSLSQLSRALINEQRSSSRIELSHQSSLRLLFDRRGPESPEDEEATTDVNRGAPTNRHMKKDEPYGFGNRPGSQPPPSPIAVPSPTAPASPSTDASVLSSSLVFRKKVKRAHEHNFSRGVYMALRDGSPVQQSDLIQALSSCVEVPMDIDITLLYRMLQVDMIRASMPRTMLRSSMIDLLSGKSIRDALKSRLDKSIESILASVFRGIDGTKYFVFFGSETMAVDDVVGLADNEEESEAFTVDGDVLEPGEVAPRPPRLVKSVTVSGASSLDQDGNVERNDELVGDDVVLMGDAFDATQDHQEHQIAHEEDAELNKDVAAATSSFSAPFFFRFECREILQEPDGRMRSISTGTNNIKPIGSRPSLLRSTSSKSVMDLVDQPRPSAVAGAPPRWQSTTPSLASVAGSPVGGVGEIAEWAVRNSAPKITLRLMTLTLPNEQLLERTQGQQVGLGVEDQWTKPTAAELFSSLPFFQRQVLKRMRKSIKEWSSVEVLRILQSGDKITPSIAMMVHKLFTHLPSACVTTVKYPLDFVSLNQENLDPLALVQKELEAGTDGLQVVKCGDWFFVVKRGDGSSVEIPYWAILTVEGDFIQLQLHHPSAEETTRVEFNRLSVLTALHLGVNAVCKRVNQYMLLLQLHETRSCNELLIPADPGTSSSSANPPSPTSTTKVSSSGRDRAFFWPGQFECDLKYSAFFRLNERMVSSIALTMLCTQALEQFQVHNRRHVFVYRDRGGHVFYIRMSVATREEESMGHSRKQSSSPALVRSNSGPTNSSASSPGILLQVFGVCCVGDEITVELCRVIERKLDEAMQQILMKLLARNTKFQLSPSDMVFTCSPVTNPASCVVYELPQGQDIEANASALLQFLSQNLGATSYIRQIYTPLPAPPSSMQSESRRTPSEDLRTESLEDTMEPAAQVEQENVEVLHPAMFGSLKRPSEGTGEQSDPTSLSPVFFKIATNDDVEESTETDQPKQPEPRHRKLLDRATFAINLNPELRLSPGFLSRVGKGLSILDVELVEEACGKSDYDEHDEKCDEEKASLALPPSVGAYMRDGDKSNQLYLRCRLWTRGPIQAVALREVYEAHLKEALSDIMMEAVIRRLRTKQLMQGSDSATVLPKEWKALTALLDAAAASSSSSVTKLAIPLTLPSWDIKNVVNQFNTFLRSSMPATVRPVKYIKRNGEFERVDADDWCDHTSAVKMVPQAETVSSMPHSDSIQSDLSEADSLASSRASLGSSTIESPSAAACFPMGSSTTLTREYSLSEVTFYSTSKSSSEAGAGSHHFRSFYYAVDMSADDGLVFYGYNLSVQVLEVMLALLARIFTWCILRDQLLRFLLLQRGGVVYSAPSGAQVVQPRALLQQHANGRVKPGDFSVNFVDFKKFVVRILYEHAVVPKSIEVPVLHFQLSAFGKMLKEMGVQLMDSSDPQGTRSARNPPTRLGDDASVRRIGSSSSMRGSRGSLPPSSGSSKSLSSQSHDVSPAPRPSGGMTVPSPTKRAAVGGATSNVSRGQPSGGMGGGGAGAAARMRNNPSATNALLAARARARGGGFPGRMGAGPGVSGSRSTTAGEVAPWDLPVTNTKTSNSSTPTPARTSTTGSDSSEGQQKPEIKSSALKNTGVSSTAGVPDKRASGVGSVQPSTTPTLARSVSQSDTRDWRALVEHTWGPRHKFCSKNAFVAATLKLLPSKPSSKADDQGVTKTNDPVKHYARAFLQHHDLHESCGAVAESSLELFKRVKATAAASERVSSIDISTETAVRSMVDIGHVLAHQRFRVSYIERWEVVTIDDEHVEDGSNTGRFRALQASMDLVNLLLFKQEFVFVGNERVVAKLLIEHTLQAMTGKEGHAVREMKLQIHKAVFHSRMEVVQRFFEQYATHLRALGFYHLRSQSSRLGRKPTNASATVGSSARASGSSTPTSVGVVVTDGEAFTEWFAHSGITIRGSAVRGRSSRSESTSDGILVLELKCDFSGVQVNVVIVNEGDLKKQQFGHQHHLEDVPTSRSSEVSGAAVTQAGQLLRRSLNTKALVHDFTIRYFHQCLLDWTLRKHDEDVNRQAPSSSMVMHNMVKGVRCFLHTYPQSPPSLSGKPGECMLETATVELPVRNLQSDFSESILVKILLRYIACHSSRYEVHDVTQFGTPDTLACHSVIGNFFNRQPPSVSAGSSRARSGTKVPGYSLLITTQELWKGKNRPKTSVLLALVRCPPPTPSSSSGAAGIGNALLLPIERAMQEAELFVKELFRAAAANYERDLLWSRLLYNDSQSLTTDVATSLSLPVQYFRVDIGPQQLEECLRLSACIPLHKIDPELSEMITVDGVCWQEFALRLRDMFAGQLREYQFEGQAACHFLLLCPSARDLIIHLTFPSGITSAAMDGDENHLLIDVCRREEPATGKFSLAQRRAITEFVNSVVHWLWRCLLYD